MLRSSLKGSHKKYDETKYGRFCVLQKQVFACTFQIHQEMPMKTTTKLSHLRGLKKRLKTRRCINKRHLQGGNKEEKEGKRVVRDFNRTRGNNRDYFSMSGLAPFMPHVNQTLFSHHPCYDCLGRSDLIQFTCTGASAISC